MTIGVRRRGVPRGAVAILALIAYVPALLARPGRMPADTKLFLYLDPGRLIGDAPFTWDTRQFGGWVPHQTIAYLWPQGPWYWLFDHLGVPDWVAHRLWIGTLLFLGAWGVLWAGRLLGLGRGGALAAAATYQLSPYILPYLSRTSAMLLPWAALGWLVGLTIRASTATQHRWRAPALMALVLLSCSAVNATAVLMIAPAPILWLVHAVWSRTVAWRAAVAAAARIGVLATAVSLWWIFMLRAQGAHGADVLSYSESLEATSYTTVSTEVLRGAGYWLFYVRDPYSFTTTASQHYMESGVGIAVSYALPLLGMAGLALTRWAQRRFAALLLAAGAILAVGVHPIWSASPLMQPLAERSRSSLSLALRSSARAIPVANLGLAFGLGALVSALAATRFRWRALAPVLAVGLAVVNLPALFNGGLVDPALDRDQDPPAAWQAAADFLSTTSSETRVLQLPGTEFGAFRWGYTSDPPLVGMTTKPLITRDLLPLGSPGVMDLLDALDSRVQQGTLDPEALAAVARFLGADTIWLTNDVAYDRYRTPLPSRLARWFAGVPDLGAPDTFGQPGVNTPDIEFVDEARVAEGAPAALAPVELYPVENPSQILRAGSATVVLVGSGDGIVDAAAAGLLHGDEAVLYAADLDAVSSEAIGTPALVILTDSNRDRAHHWRSSQDLTGFTETGGAGSDLLVRDDGDQRLPVFGLEEETVAAEQTVARFNDGFAVRATGYGEPFAYRPEDRPAMAVDGDPTTAWVVGDRQNPVGEAIWVSATDGTLTLLQPQSTVPTRMITRVRVSVAGMAPFEVDLDDRSLRSPGQRVDLPAAGEATIEIVAVGMRTGGTDSGDSPVGFAELGVGAHLETVVLPAWPERADSSGPVAVVLSRERVDALDRWRRDPEAYLVREFQLPRDGEFSTTVTLRLDQRASDAVLAEVLGQQGPAASQRLTGSVDARGWFVADGDRATGWTSEFGAPLGATLTVPLDDEVAGFDIVQPTDEVHSLITTVEVGASGSTTTVEVAPPDARGVSTVVLPTPVSGPELTLTIVGVDERITIDRRFAEPTVLPVSILEIEGEGIAGSTAETPAALCRNDLLVVDGRPLPLAITAADLAELTAGRAVTVGPCDGAPVSLPTGTHRIESAPGSATALDVDRVTLLDGSPERLPSPNVTVLSRTRTERVVEVAPCPAGCWVVLGEGFNEAWSARTSAGSLGPPVQLSGGFNGWWLAPTAEATVVTMSWGGQTPVSAALLLSGAGVLVCLALARPRRRRVAPMELTSDPPHFASARSRCARRHALWAAAALVAAAGLFASPATAVPAAVLAVVIVLTNRPRVAGVAGLALMALLAARIVISQVRNRGMASAAWPLLWDNLHRYGLLVIVLVLAGALVSDADSVPEGEPINEAR